jgi:transcription elongation factor GreB
MGRWKPPPPKSSPYITPAGYAALQKELNGLWTRRADVVKALAAAAAEGDRSENAEYIYRKKELGGLDYRIRYLQKRLPGLNIVRETPKQDRIFFGARISLDRGKQRLVDYRIVGPDEADPSTGQISMDSPLARALLKKQVGDEVALDLDQGREILTVVSIGYDAATDD